MRKEPEYILLELCNSMSAVHLRIFTEMVEGTQWGKSKVKEEEMRMRGDVSDNETHN